MFFVTVRTFSAPFGFFVSELFFSRWQKKEGRQPGEERCQRRCTTPSSRNSPLDLQRTTKKKINEEEEEETFSSEGASEEKCTANLGTNTQTHSTSIESNRSEMRWTEGREEKREQTGRVDWISICDYKE